MYSIKLTMQQLKKKVLQDFKKNPAQPPRRPPTRCSGVPCPRAQPLEAGVGSTDWQTRTLAVSIAALQGSASGAPRCTLGW